MLFESFVGLLSGDDDFLRDSPMRDNGFDDREDFGQFHQQNSNNNNLNSNNNIGNNNHLKSRFDNINRY